MKENRFSEIDSENIKMAEKIHQESEKIKLDKDVNDNIIRFIRNGNKKKISGAKVFRIGTAIAACFVLAAGMVVWNDTRINHSGMNRIWENETQLHQKEDKKVVASARNIGNVAKSYEEIKQKIQQVNDETSIMEGVADVGGLTTKSISNDYSPLVTPDDLKTDANTKSNSPYSDTNEQTKGVHEGDIVKTDGRYIYTLIVKNIEDDKKRSFQVPVTKVSGTKMKKVSTIKVKDNKINKNGDISEMYISGDRLVLIGTEYGSGFRETCKGCIDDTVSAESKKSSVEHVKTVIFIYDISDIKSPKLISRNEQDGYNQDTRLVDGYLYTVSSWTVLDKDKDYIPEINHKKIQYDCICIPEVLQDSSYAVITSINIEDGKDINQSAAVLGNASKVYVSQNHIYLVNEAYRNDDISDTDKGKTMIADYKKNKNFDTKRYKATEREVRELKKIYSQNRYDMSSISKRHTVSVMESYTEMEIMKYEYKDGKLTYVANCTLEGETDDRFSLDERNGYLRLVVHRERERYLSANKKFYDAKGKEIEEQYLDSKELDGAVNSNTVYTLDEKLNKKGEIKGLAKKESIYAARYLGDYGYFVTYEETDPLFTVDFKDMENPKIIGELKMPGFSDYLQFFNENLLFGIGEGEESRGDEIPIKLDMYDVSKGSAKRKTSLLIKGDWYTPATYNSKALLMDSEKNIIGFPAERSWYDKNYEYTMKDYYLLFSYKNGKFQQLCKIQLKEESTEDTRGLYIGNYLYIVSQEEMQVVNLKNYKVEGKLSIK